MQISLSSVSLRAFSMFLPFSSSSSYWLSNWLISLWINWASLKRRCCLRRSWKWDDYSTYMQLWLRKHIGYYNYMYIPEWQHHLWHNYWSLDELHSSVHVLVFLTMNTYHSHSLKLSNLFVVSEREREREKERTLQLVAHNITSRGLASLASCCTHSVYSIM